MSSVQVAGIMANLPRHSSVLGTLSLATHTAWGRKRIPAVPVSTGKVRSSLAMFRNPTLLMWWIASIPMKLVKRCPRWRGMNRIERGPCLLGQARCFASVVTCQALRSGTSTWISQLFLAHKVSLSSVSSREDEDKYSVDISASFWEQPGIASIACSLPPFDRDHSRQLCLLPPGYV